MTKIESLADACWNGACNPRGIIRSLAGAIADDRTATDTAAYRIILGQLAYLAGESAGPSDRAIADWLTRERLINRAITDWLTRDGRKIGETI